MFKNNLIYKVLGIIGSTLIVCFACMGIMALWLEFNAIINLEIKGSRDLNKVIMRDIAEYMMKGESKEVSKFILEAKEKKFALDLKIFNMEGKEPDATSGSADQEVVSVLASGKELEKQFKMNGVHALKTVVPLVNEERCKQCHDAGPKYLGALQMVTSLEEGYSDAIKLSIMLSLAGFFFFFALLFALYFFFKKTIVKEILELANSVTELARGEGDLTKSLPVYSQDEIGQLSLGMNQLIAKLREIISNLYVQGSKIALSVCEVTNGTNKNLKDATEQKEQAVSVAVAAEEMAATLNSVADSTHQAASLSNQVDSAAGEGMASVGDSFTCMEMINESMTKTLETVERLETSSNKIGEIINLIEDIADQTNLLALNAAIEAARAGEHGRGFAVVADEVKNLSAKTASSTKEISQIIKKIQIESREAAVSISEEKVRVEEGVAKSMVAKSCLENILQLAGESTDMISQIASATEEQSATTNEISLKIHHVSEIATNVHHQMEHDSSTFQQLTEVAEQIYATVGRFTVGNYHDNIKANLCEMRDRTLAAIETALAENRISMEKLFDRNYKPIPNTAPQKYTTNFDSFFDQVISPIQEQILAKNSDITFLVCVDDNGYLPSHNLKFTKPLTGDPETDKNNNRTKRLFNDKTGIRAARNTDPFLLQTYMRDTGEIINDMSTPLYLGGRHWGGIRIGYQAK
jgi:methyl-accepting chemotaxis protein